MATEPVIRELTPLDLFIDLTTDHAAGARYRYRGTVVEKADDGWDVLAGDRPRDAQYAEIGWGANMEEAMTVANEHVDGFERVRRRAA